MARRKTPPTPVELPPLTDEQEAVVDAVLQGQDLKVQAFAGSGKTTTLLAVARAYLERHPGARVLYVTFNNRLLKEAKARFEALDASLPGTGKRRIYAFTNHGLAFHHLGWRYSDRLLSGGSLLQVRHALLERLPGLGDFRPLLYPEDVAIIVLEALTRYMYSADARPGREHLPELLPYVLDDPIYEPVVRALVALMWQAWQLLSAPGELSDLPITHDVYLKTFQLMSPRLNYDLILLDEAQDANPAMLDIILRQPAQKVCVGDAYQQIYAWRGAVNAMASLPWPSYPLTTSWRFGDAIAAYASRLLQTFLGEEAAIRGAPGKTSSIGPLAAADAVIARTNVGALRELLMLLQKGSRVAFAGPLADLTDALMAAYRLWRGYRPAHPEFAVFRSWDQLLALMQRLPAVANQYRPYVNMVEEFRDEVPRICQTVRSLVAVDAGGTRHSWDVTVSTAHRAKGREWRRVRLAADWAAFYLVAFDGTVNAEEVNVAYVAATRAAEALDPGGLDEAVERAAGMLGEAATVYPFS